MYISSQYMPYMPPYNLRQNTSYIRILHASPNAPAVDVYANGNIIARNLFYRNFTAYLGVQPGTYNIKVFAAGTTQNPLIDTNIELPVSTIFTIAAIGKFPQVELLPVQDPVRPLIPGMVMLRFVNLSPDTPAINVMSSGGISLFENIAYRQISDYVPVLPGKHVFELYRSETGERILYVPNIVLLPNRFYTIYAIGLLQTQPFLQVLIPLDGNSYIQP